MNVTLDTASRTADTASHAWPAIADSARERGQGRGAAAGPRSAPGRPRRTGTGWSSSGRTRRGPAPGPRPADSSGRSAVSARTHSSTYSRCSRRISRRGSSGSRSSSCRCSAITAGLFSAKSTWKSTSAISAAAGVRVLGQPAAPPAQQFLADRDQRGGQHRLLAGEVVVQRGTGDAGRRADVVHRDPVVAAGRRTGRPRSPGSPRGGDAGVGPPRPECPGPAGARRTDNCLLCRHGRPSASRDDPAQPSPPTAGA